MRKFLNKYESVIIVNPNLKYIGDIKDKIINIIDSLNVESFEDLGNRELAYHIKGEEEGHFIKIDFYARNEIIDVLERYFRINSDILKYITLKTQETIQDKGEFDNSLYKILDIYTEYNWENQPLDTDEVDRLAELLKTKLNLLNGNITEEEYYNSFE
jgi:small subunit ribosomal protein S6